MNGRPDYPPRPPSEQLVDLHVYLVPAELWQDHLQSAVNQIINDTVSAGFIRVLPETTINAMRSDLENQLDDMLPRDYVFLKSVGRCLARVRPKQEYQLKAKNFLPPQAYSPEIFILEVSPEVRATFPPSGASSERSDSRPAPNSSDPYSHYRPIPPIKNGSSSGYPYNGDPNSGETARTPGDSSQTPLSASPPNSPIPGETKPVRSPSAGDYRSQQGEGYLPPLSATPPHTPDTSKYRLTNGADAGLDDLERRRMDEMYRHHLPAYPCSQPPLQHHPAAAPARLGPNHHLSTILESPAPHPAQHQALPPSGGQPRNLSHTFGDTQKVAPPVWPESTRINQGFQAQNNSNIPTQVCYGAQNDAPNANQGGNMNKVGYRRRNNVRKGKSKEMQPVKVTSKNKVQTSDSQADQVLLENPSTTDRESISDDSHEKKSGYARKFHRKPRSGKHTSKRRNAGSGRRQAEEKAKREWEEEERRRKEEERRRWEEEQRKNAENRRRESEDERLRREAEERRRREEDEARRRQLEAMNRTPADRAREKERLMEELEQARQDRKAMERRREEYVRKAKGLQARTQQKRNQARDLWKKKYFEEKKKTAPLEDQSNKLKQELDSLHKRIMATLEGPKDAPKRASDKPSSQSNYKIQATRLQHDIEDLQRRVDNVKMKLTAEMKLRNQAESELRALRAEVTQKKINLTLTRSQLGPISQQKDQTVNNPAPSPMVTQR